MWKGILLFFRWVVKQMTYKQRIEEMLGDMRIELLRVKFLQLVQHSPTEISIICSVFDEYKNMGGDSWIDDIYLKWKKEYVK